MISPSVLMQSEELLPEGLEIGFKLVPAIIVISMMALFLAVGFVFKVADTDDMWVAGRSIGNVENGMAIGANWMSAASYLGMAALIALSGLYGSPSSSAGRPATSSCSSSWRRRCGGSASTPRQTSW